MIRYRIAAYPFTLTFAPTPASPQLQHDLDRVLLHFRLPDDTEQMDTPVGMIHASPPAHPLSIQLNNPVPDVMTVIDHVEPEIVNYAIRQSPGHLWIHGSGLLLRDELVLLVARTGTGKTTVSLGLLAHGGHLLTDDILLFQPDSGSVIPVPRCPKTRPGAAEHLAAVGFDLARHAERLGRYVLLPPERFITEPLDAPVRRVYILSRDADRPGGVQPLDLTSGILDLLPHTNLMGIDPALDMAHHLFRDTAFYRLNLTDYAADLRRIYDGS